MVRRYLVAAALLLALSPPIAAQSVKAGIEAWQRADYSGAVAIWRPLAEGGDADAAFNLGQAYRLGRGVPTNLSIAKSWFERAARHATGLRLYALPGEGSTGWLLDVPGGRLTIMLSPEVWRGFSGEGRALHRLAAPAASIAAVRAALGWEPRLSVEDLVATTGQPRADVEGSLAALASSGIVGLDLADDGFYRRESSLANAMLAAEAALASG